MPTINDRLIDILETKGPMLSGQLAREYEENNKISPVNSRKAISRATKPINKIREIKFDNNQSFMYLENQYMNSDFRANLFDSMKKSSKAYYSVVEALLNHYGFLNKDYLPAYTILPIEPLKGHRGFERVINDIEKLGIIELINEDIYMISERFYADHNYSKYKAIELAKKTILDDINDWSRKVNLTAYNSGKVLEEKAVFSKFQWCFSSPSYITGIKSSDNPGIIIADVILDKNVTTEDLYFFMSKIDIIRHFKNGLNFIPVIVAERIDAAAFEFLKMNGVLIFQIGNLFSKSYENALKNLVNIVEHASAIISKNPDKFINYLEDIKKIEGKFNNVQGQLFELAVGYHYSLSSRFIEINKLIFNHNTGKSNEIDVYVDFNNEIRIIECKGYKYQLDAEYIKKWLSETIINIRSWILTREATQKIITFEIWCTGGFDEEAEKILERQSVNTKKYNIVYLDKLKIIERAKSINDKVLLDVINSYF